jgi:hypothetical protein
LAYRIAMTVCSLSPAGSNRSFRRRPFRLSSSARRSARPQGHRHLRPRRADVRRADGACLFPRVESISQVGSEVFGVWGATHASCPAGGRGTPRSKRRREAAELPGRSSRSRQWRGATGRRGHAGPDGAASRRGGRDGGSLSTCRGAPPPGFLVAAPR